MMTIQNSDIMLYKLWQTGIDVYFTFKSVKIFFLKQSMINLKWKHKKCNSYNSHDHE